MNDMIYVVTAVDTSESADGKARVLGAFKNEDDAKAYVQNDMEDYADRLADACGTVDFDAMTIVNEDADTICNWNIEVVEVQ